MAATELDRITGVVYFLACRTNPWVVRGKFPRKKAKNIGCQHQQAEADQQNHSQTSRDEQSHQVNGSKLVHSPWP